MNIVHRFMPPFGSARCGGLGELVHGNLDAGGVLQRPLEICPGHQSGGSLRRLGEKRRGQDWSGHLFSPGNRPWKGE